jgi:hypothetical protein
MDSGIRRFTIGRFTIYDLEDEAYFPVADKFFGSLPAFYINSFGAENRQAGACQPACGGKQQF